jgi:hypothetical protein
MASTPARPLGITIAASVVLVTGIASIIAGIALLGWTGTGLVPTSGDAEVSGATALIVGAIGIAAGLALSTLRRWAWILGVVATGLGIGAAAWAVLRHGLDGVVWVAAVTGVVSLVVLAYLLRWSVRAAFGRQAIS